MKTPSWFAGLQSRLIVAFVGLTAVALLTAGGAFVLLTRHDEEQRRLDETASVSPALAAEFFLRELRGDPPADLSTFAHDAADRYGVRLLIADNEFKVVADSKGTLEGKSIVATMQEHEPMMHDGRLSPYTLVYPESGPGSDLILLSPALQGPRARVMDSGGMVRGLGRRPGSEYSLYLAVPRQTIGRAWLGLLPTLGLASVIALPVAVLLAIVVARYITRPLHRLTLATHQMAEGTFDVDVEMNRRDEVGQLAGAFSTMAERVGQAQVEMRTLIANVSHDLKTPLTSILGFGQALRSGQAANSAEVQRMGEVIHEEARRLTARLDDLMYLSELEGGQAVVEREEVDLGKLLRAAVARVEPDLRARRVELTVDAPAELVGAADGAKLERAVENLLENARRYTPDGGRLRVSAKAVAGQPGATVIEVANTAEDIEPQEVPRLFERFYRRDRSRSGTRGSGLGLPIARDLVELQGGTLDAALEGREIVFRLSLPAPR